MDAKAARARPKVVVSRCIEHEPCRYNGQMINDELVAKLKDHADYVTVCPEADIGLGIPRDPVRVVKVEEKLLLFQPATGKEYSRDMISYSDAFLSALSGIDGFILKYRSPSCGLKDVKVYVGRGGPDDIKGIESGSGFFGSAVLKKFTGLAIEDEARLGNPVLREHFLTKLYALASYREAANLRSWKALTDYHARNKLLLTAYGQAKMRDMGKIAAGGKDLEQALKEYRDGLYSAFSKIPKYGSMINALMHAFGYFKDKVSADEKKFFASSLEEYRDERIPLSAVQRLLYSWAIRFDEKYLLQQTLFDPFPQDLAKITDASRVRDYEPIKWGT
ncbi:MAG: DUF523 and DUF1722 domain-containing protein [Candidatus Altiarchaeota archaeon]|nr:DUF523 and DUF1722 domain-containing protein [Candidatus Altiarchaeota archaeon]